MSVVGETSKPALPAEDMTLGDVLETAMEFERAAHAFYAALADRVHPDARPLVLELAAEEQRHYALLADLARDASVVTDLAMTVAPAPTDDRFRDSISIPTISDQPFEDEILDCAASRERIAYEHYAYLAEATPPGPIQALFAFLRDEEKMHEDAVGSRWAAMFSVI